MVYATQNTQHKHKGENNMKIKNKDFNGLIQTLNKVGSGDMPYKTARKFRRLLGEIEKQVELYNTNIRELDEIKDEDKKKEEFITFFEEEVELNFEGFTEDDLDGLQCSVADITFLELVMVNDGQNDVVIMGEDESESNEENRQ